MLPLLFARRYLFSAQSRSVVNLISGLSVAALAMPVAAMIILLSVFNGFEMLVQANCSAFDADLTLSVREGQTFATEEIDTTTLARIPGVRAQSFILEQSVLLEHNGRQATATLRGVDDAYEEVLPFGEALTTGSEAVRIGELERLVIGQTMAHMLAIRSLADADVNIYAVRRESFSSLLPTDNYTRRRVPVGGAFTLDLETEQTSVLASLRLAQELFAHPGKASGLLIRITEGADTERVRQAIKEVVGERFRVRMRYELRASFYRIMTYEKWGIFFVTLLVLAVASFSVVGALTILIVEKHDDIFTLKALGADQGLLRTIFRHEGWLICLLGGAAGLGVGIGATLMQQHFGLIEIPAESFLTKSYPVEFRPTDLLAVVAAFAAISCLLTEVTVRSMIKKRRNKKLRL